MESPDILIIGAGIVGCGLARELARTGQRVVVLDAGKVGCASSSAAAGLLSPRFDDSANGPFLDLCRRGASIYEEWINELREDGAGDTGYRRTGLLSIATSPDEAAKLRASLAQDVSSGRRAEWLDRSELRRREPALSERVLGAAFYLDDAHVEPARLVQQVARVAALAGVEIRENEPVRKLERQGDRITAVHTNSNTYRPGLLILAAGAWTGELAEILGLRLPTRPVKGQMVLAECRVPPIKTPLHAGEALLIPWPDGRLALGVTVEEVGFDDRVRLDSLLRILRQTIELVPAVGELALSYAWAGLRPATPDGWPYMGPIQPWKNLWISAGHFRKGTLLAPICAKLLAESIRTDRLDEALVAFRPERPIKEIPEMKAMLRASLLTATILTAGTIVGQDKAEPPKIKGTLPANWGKIGLSDEQKQTIFKLQDKYRELSFPVEEQQKTLVKKLSVLLAEERKQMEKLLTEEQRKKLAPPDVNDERPRSRIVGAIPKTLRMLDLTAEQQKKMVEIQRDNDPQFAPLQKELKELDKREVGFRVEEKKELEQVLTDENKKRLREIILKKAGEEDKKDEKK